MATLTVEKGKLARYKIEPTVASNGRNGACPCDLNPAVPLAADLLAAIT